MKKAVFALALALGAAPAARAQEGPGTRSSTDYEAGGDGTESRNTGFGLKGGYNLASIEGANASLFTNRDNLKDFHAGIYAQYGFTNFASLMVELLYSRKGFQSNFPGTTAQNIRLDYIELPLLFVANLTETLSIHVGPQVALLNNVNEGGATVALAANGYNTLDYGGIAGAEARIGIAKLGARFDWSLGKVYKDGATVRYSTGTGTTSVALADNNIRNQVFQVYLGLGFKH